MYINFRTVKGKKTKCYYEGLLDTKTGDIIARSNKPAAHPYEKRLNINTKTNQFPYTDEDFIILAAKEALKEATQ